MQTAVAIYVFPEAEILDFAGPYEVFTTASRVFEKRSPGASAPFVTFTVARKAALVRSRAGLVVLPDYDFHNCPLADVLVIPGGDVTAEVNDPHIVEWIQAYSRRVSITASVCTGAFLLAKAGLLDGKAATTHWEDIEDFRTQFSNVIVREGVRWVDEGYVVTSAGIAAGIDMSLHLVSRIAGQDLALATARHLEVPYSVAKPLHRADVAKAAHVER